MKYSKIFESDFSIETEMPFNVYNGKKVTHIEHHPSTGISTNHYGLEYANFMDFTDKEIKEISSCLKSSIKVLPFADIRSGVLRTESHANIYKLEDEWYYVFCESTRRYYKCDQMRGLLECLQFIKEGVEKIRKDYFDEEKKKINMNESIECKENNYEIIPLDSLQLFFSIHRKLDFPINEVGKIRNIIGNSFDIKISSKKKNYFGSDEPVEFKSLRIGETTKYPKGAYDSELNITYYDDDYYVVQYFYYYLSKPGVRFYKCDQYEGLIDFLKDYKNDNFHPWSLRSAPVPDQQVPIRESIDLGKYYKEINVERTIEFSDSHPILNIPENQIRKIRMIIGEIADAYEVSLSHSLPGYYTGADIAKFVLGNESHQSNAINITNIHSSFKGKDNDFDIKFTLREDEYYLIRYKSYVNEDTYDSQITNIMILKFYLCDQYEGLEEFLQDLKDKKLPGQNKKITESIKESLTHPFDESEKYYKKLDDSEVGEFSTQHGMIDMSNDQIKQIQSSLGKYFNVYINTNYNYNSPRIRIGDGNIALKISAFQNLFGLKGKKTAIPSFDKRASIGFEMILGCHEDEYYLIKYNHYEQKKWDDGTGSINLVSEFYLCDQYEGLLKFLQDLKDIKLSNVKKITESAENKFMRNIKLFEEYNPYYQKISEDDHEDIKKRIGSSFALYDDEMDEDEIDIDLLSSEITDEEIKKIMNFFPNCELLGTDIEGEEDEYFGVSDYEMILFKKGDKYKEIIVDLTKCNDEWYYITFLFGDASSYKCDQFEGLIKLLQNKNHEIKEFLQRSHDTNIKKITESVENELYKRVEKEDYENFSSNKKELFTPNENEEIKSIFYEGHNPSLYNVYIDVPSSSRFGSWSNGSSEQYPEIMITQNGIGSVGTNFYIYPYVDEYYQVECICRISDVRYARYYRCDQFDGLLQFLKDIESGKLKPITDTNNFRDAEFI